MRAHQHCRAFPVVRGDGGEDFQVFQHVRGEHFRAAYAGLCGDGDGAGSASVAPRFAWRADSTYVRRPPYWQNEMCPGVEGPVTRLRPDDIVLPIFESAQRYLEREQELIVFAGNNYGCGSSRDWAAKGVRLLGVRVIAAELLAQ